MVDLNLFGGNCCWNSLSVGLVRLFDAPTCHHGERSFSAILLSFAVLGQLLSDLLGTSGWILWSTRLSWQVYSGKVSTFLRPTLKISDNLGPIGHLLGTRKGVAGSSPLPHLSFVFLSIAAVARGTFPSPWKAGIQPENKCWSPLLV